MAKPMQLGATALAKQMAKRLERGDFSASFFAIGEHEERYSFAESVRAFTEKLVGKRVVLREKESGEFVLSVMAEEGSVA